MRRRYLWLLGLLVGLLATGLAEEAYYPSRPGLSWTYSNGTTQALGGPRQLGDAQVLVLTHYFEGEPVAEDYLSFEGGTHSHGSASSGQMVRYLPPLLLYPDVRLEPGLSWQSQARAGGVELSLMAEVLGVQGVDTPLGRFNALHIRQRTLTSSGGRSVLDLYFVPTLGVVRYVSGDTVIDLIDTNFWDD